MSCWYFHTCLRNVRGVICPGGFSEFPSCSRNGLDGKDIYSNGDEDWSMLTVWDIVLDLTINIQGFHVIVGCDKG